jgi:hypothetical protein
MARLLILPFPHFQPIYAYLARRFNGHLDVASLRMDYRHAHVVADAQRFAFAAR